MKGFILEHERIGWSATKTINTVHYVEGLKYNLMRIYKILDRENEVKVMTNKCFIRNSRTKRIVMPITRVENMYVVDLDSIEGDYLSCIRSQTDDSIIWHRHLGLVCSSFLNKVVGRDVVRSFTKLTFTNDRICVACAKGKQTESSFKDRKGINTSIPLELLHMELCRPFRVLIRGKKFSLVVFNDFNGYTWTMVLRTKNGQLDKWSSLTKSFNLS